MYARQLYIENNGPIKGVHLRFPLNPQGLPIPVILVGENGSGKTNLLSIIADALFEAAASHYSDVVPGVARVERAWFRMVGAATITLGTPGSVVVLELKHEEKTYLFKEKSGSLPASEVLLRLPEELRLAANWPDGAGAVKELGIVDEDARNIFEAGVYAYFPASRSEVPHWLNRDSVPMAGFNITQKIVTRLGKPIYVEKGIERFQQWLLSVMLEARYEMTLVPKPEGGNVDWQISGDVARSYGAGLVLGLLNTVLSIILDDPSARFIWLGRNGAKVGIARNGQLSVPGLEALSGGQSTLLAIFGTILRYADNESGGLILQSGMITGMCIIDEADAHMHIDLQHRALPNLIKLFPKIQFFISSHSPLFVLGMERVFQSEGVNIVEMPSGLPVQAEAYNEFGRALEALQGTKSFAAAIMKEAETLGKLLVLLEGETDPTYLLTAARILGRDMLLEGADFNWIGAKDHKTGQGFNTGKDALNQALALLKAKPDLVKRPILLIYDNDANKAPEDCGNVHVRSMPSNPANQIVEAGIENLLSPCVITDDMFDKVEKKRKGGGRTITTSLNKMRLCRYACEVKADAGDFTLFSAVLDMIEYFVLRRG